MKVIELDLKEVSKLTPSLSLNDGKKFIKRTINFLRDMPHPINKTNGMAEILLLSPQGSYNRKFPKGKEYIDS